MKEVFFSNRFIDMGLGEEDNTLSKIKKEKESANIPVLDLVNSNPTQVGLNFPQAIVSHNLGNIENSTYTPDPKGLEESRIAISNYYLSKNIKVCKEDLLLTSSTSEAYSFLFKLLANPGDEILVPSPGYPLFSYLAKFENLEVIEYPLIENAKGEWHYSLSEVKSRVTSKTKLVILVSPANPTGSYLDSANWLDWITWCREVQIPLIVDEVFAPYFFTDFDSYFYPMTREAPIFVLNGISKLLALPQLKLGWIHVQGKDPFKKQAIAGLELLADTYLSVNQPAQVILPEILKWASMIQNQILSRIKRNLFAASNVFLENQNLIWRTGNAGWYGWLEIKITKYTTAEEIAEHLLIEKNIYVHPGDWYGFPDKRKILVLSLILPEDQFLGGINELTSFLK